MALAMPGALHVAGAMTQAASADDAAPMVAGADLSMFDQPVRALDLSCNRLGTTSVYAALESLQLFLFRRHVRLVTRYFVLSFFLGLCLKLQRLLHVAFLRGLPLAPRGAVLHARLGAEACKK